MEVSWSRLRKFAHVLEGFQHTYCGKGGDCEFKVATCPIREALAQAGYEDMEWCARCNGYQSDVRRVERKGKALTYHPIFTGGYIVGVMGGYRTLYVCICSAGQFFSDLVPHGMAQFDFSKNPDGCFVGHKRDMQEWEKGIMQKTRDIQLERAKERAKQFLEGGNRDRSNCS
jgi:hypothetical protein